MNIDIGYSVVETRNGGFLIAGMKNSGYLWLMKTDELGEFIWEKTFFEEAGPSSTLIKIIKDAEGDYIAVGTAWIFTRDIACVKINEHGDLLWNKIYGDNSTEFGKTIIEALDGGYVIGGIKKVDKEYDIWLIKIDKEGNVIWNKTYDYGGNENIYSITLTWDGGYLILGSISIENQKETWVIKINRSGEAEWNKTYSYGIAFSITQARNNNYIITGFVKQNDSESIWLLKINETGGAVWNKTYGSGSGYVITKSPDNNYVVLGATWSNETGTDVLLMKVDEDGNVIWRKTYGGASDDFGFDIASVTDDGYVIVGGTSSFEADGIDVLLIKVSRNGALEWLKTYSGSKVNYSSSSILNSWDLSTIILNYMISTIEDNKWKSRI